MMKFMKISGKLEEMNSSPNLKNDVFSTSFLYAIYKMAVKEGKGLRRKNSSTFQSLAKNYFRSLRDEDDEPIYIYTNTFTNTYIYLGYIGEA